ncbi:MAG: helicase associated domain-containing protein [Prevotella sp.]|nr:helicase associated domain-containing protein [Prevotella sp.]
MFSSEAMTQDEAWKKNYDEVMSFITENGRNLSKYNLEERRLYTWLKHNRKQMNQGLLKPEREVRFRELLAMAEQYKRKNQYE